MRHALTIAHLTLIEARRRRILLAGLLCGLLFVALFATGLSFVERSFRSGTAARIAVRNTGTVASLLSPADALWRLAAYHMLPPIARDLSITPFVPMFPPSAAMIVWAVGYVMLVMAIALRQFRHRPL